MKLLGQLKPFIKKGDFVIIFCIILLSNLPLVFVKSSTGNSSACSIVVSQNNKIIGTFPLNSSKELKRISFDFDVDGKIYQGILETKENKVRLLRLPEEVVPKSIHSDFSWIEDDTRLIVALPVSLIVQIRSENKNENQPSKEAEVDAIVN